MIRAEEYFKKSDSTHFDEIKALATSNSLNGWADYFWSGVYLYNYAPDGTYYDLIVEVLEESFFEGLSYLSEKDCYLEAVKILGRLYLETQQYDLALNMLQMLIIKDTNVPDWVYLRFVFAQMHSDTAQRLVDEPKYFFEKVERIDCLNEASVSQRNAIFQEFLQICVQYHTKDGIALDTNALFEKALEYEILHTEAWKAFASCFPDVFGEFPPEAITDDDDTDAEASERLSETETDEATDTSDVNSISEALINELECENAALMEKIHALQKEMAELLKQNQNYEQLLEEKKSVIQQVTANEIQIDSINKRMQSSDGRGHDLLEGRKKILVVGQVAVSTDKLLGVSKAFGYEKSDFEFWDEYDKIKSYADRMAGGSFSGIIAGPMPHKVSGLGDHSSMIEKMKQPGYPHMEEARSESGELKLTKHSFRKALERMTQHLLAIQ